MKLLGSHAAWNGLREDVRLVMYEWLLFGVGYLVVDVFRVLLVYVEGDGWGFLSSELGDSLL